MTKRFIPYSRFWRQWISRYWYSGIWHREIRYTDFLPFTWKQDFLLKC